MYTLYICMNVCIRSARGGTEGELKPYQGRNGNLSETNECIITKRMYYSFNGFIVITLELYY